MGHDPLLELVRAEAGQPFDDDGLVAGHYYHGLHAQREAEELEVQVEPCAQA